MYSDIANLLSKPVSGRVAGRVLFLYFGFVRGRFRDFARGAGTSRWPSLFRFGAANDVFGGGTTADPFQNFAFIPTDGSGAKINLSREPSLAYEVVKHAPAKAGQFQDICNSDNFSWVRVGRHAVEIEH